MSTRTNSQIQAAQAQEPMKEETNGVYDIENGTDQETGSASAGASHPRNSLPKWKWTVILVGNALMALINGYDVSNVANIQVPIYKAFGHIELLPWISLSYSLANAAVIPLTKKLLNFLDMKAVAVVSCLFCIAGSALAGAAPNIQAIIVGRVLSAIGSAPLYQIGLSYNVTFAHPHELGLAQALMGATFAIGLITGPVVGGAFAENEHATWRWAFYIILPLTFPVLTCVMLFPPFHLPTSKSTFVNLREIDWIGCVLHMGTFVLLGLATIFSGPTWAWNSASSIVCWTLLGVVFVAYLVQQAFGLATTYERRIFPVHLLKNRTVGLVCICVLCNCMAYGVTLYYTPIYFAFTRGAGALAAAVRLLPFICVFIVFLFVAGGLLPAVRRYKIFYVVGGASILLGAGLQQTLTAQSSESRAMGFDAILGAGIGLQWQLGPAVTSVILPPEERLGAAALINLATLGGVAIALSIAGTVYQNVGYNQVNSAVAGMGFSSKDIRSLLAGTDSPILNTSPAVLELSVKAVTKTLLRCFYITLAAGAIGFIAACCMKFEAPQFKKPPEKQTGSGESDNGEKRQS